MDLFSKKSLAASISILDNMFTKKSPDTVTHTSEGKQPVSPVLPVLINPS
jgi:hypothetical protein